MACQRSMTIRIRMPRFIARLRADESGAAAVEFALVALPFFGLLFGIVQTSLVMFAGQVLQTTVADVSRKIMTGQLKTKADFEAALCASASMTMFDCNKLLVQVQSFGDFSVANPAIVNLESRFRRLAESLLSVSPMNGRSAFPCWTTMQRSWPSPLFSTSPTDEQHPSPIIRHSPLRCGHARRLGRRVRTHPADHASYAPRAASTLRARST